MKHNKYKVDGKTIDVFDDAIPYARRCDIYQFLANSYYKITGGAGVTLEGGKDRAMQSMFTEEDLNNFGIMKDLPLELHKIIKGYDALRSYSLLLNYSSVPYYHPDSPYKYTILYYADLKWDKDWGGETMFANQNATEIGYTSMYVPGRIVIFDSSIPHRPCTPIYNAPNHRLTFVINIGKNNEKNIT